jgi:Cu-processing system permease protein
MTPSTFSREMPEVRIVKAIARKELNAAVNSRWFWLWAVAFAGLAALLTSVALPDSSVDGYVGFGRTAASLVSLVQIIVPIMGLTLGALSIAGQRETGALRFLLSHPITRTETFVGTYLGLAAALAVTTFGGFGLAGFVAIARGVPATTATFVWIAGLSWLLAIAMLGVGMLVSTVAKTSAAALGGAVFLWLILVFLGDLGLMGTAVATRMPVGVLFSAALLNPTEAFRLAALSSLAGSLDVLGPAGRFAVDQLGDSLLLVLALGLALWAVVPTTAAWLRFTGRSDI